MEAGEPLTVAVLFDEPEEAVEEDDLARWMAPPALLHALVAWVGLSSSLRDTT